MLAAGTEMRIHKNFEYCPLETKATQIEQPWVLSCIWRVREKNVLNVMFFSFSNENFGLFWVITVKPALHDCYQDDAFTVLVPDNGSSDGKKAFAFVQLCPFKCVCHGFFFLCLLCCIEILVMMLPRIGSYCSDSNRSAFFRDNEMGNCSTTIISTHVCAVISGWVSNKARPPW